MSSADDGRVFSQYAEDHCVCAYCWSPMMQVYTEDRWIAVCSLNRDHVGTHHQAFKDAEIQKHSVTVGEVSELYRRTEFADELGLARPVTGKALQEKFQENRRLLRGDHELR